jgi:hypothetical protein
MRNKIKNNDSEKMTSIIEAQIKLLKSPFAVFWDSLEWLNGNDGYHNIAASKPKETICHEYYSQVILERLQFINRRKTFEVSHKKFPKRVE